MVRALVRLGVLQAGLLLASPVQAIPYWFAWEGNDFPENQGWTRTVYNNPDVRTLADGMMTLDGLNTGGGWDAYQRFFGGQLDPDPGELFIMRWRMRVEAIEGGNWDPIVYVLSDDAWMVSFHFSLNRIWSSVEGPGGTLIPFEPGQSHSYEFQSQDMRTYSLLIDGSLIHTGQFSQNIGPSELGWGDGGGVTRSRSTWDYFRVGVAAPEASTVTVLTVLGVAATGVRRR
jgi:hypothetical protein